jgi:hypothetical protein
MKVVILFLREKISRVFENYMGLPTNFHEKTPHKNADDAAMRKAAFPE